MSYQVLARKYRPRTFEAMVGQEHVLRALINALEQGRLHHAYLFTGTRGVGKTTLARLLAKCLNCEKGVSAYPCEQCTNCQEINGGRFIDLLEVDAASRTKVEDTRDLLENVPFAPTRGRYKVYLIDEVHMLSSHSFNALLKTLEEPPPHVKFLLATTDPQRLPATVLSRCLQFNLKNLPIERIKAHLAYVLTQETMDYEPSALLPLAQAANGSLRDALSLLDQAIAYSGDSLLEANVRAMLGTIDQTPIFELIEALTASDGTALIRKIEQIAELSIDFDNVLEELIGLLHRIAITQVIPDVLAEQDDSAKERILSMAAHLTREEVQLYYQIALIGRRDLPLAPSPRNGFEMVMLRMLAFQPNNISQATPPTHQEKPVNSSQIKNTSVTSPASSTPLASTEPTSTLTNKKQTLENINWPLLVPELQLTGFAQALAQNCTLKNVSNQQMHLLLDPQQAALQNARQAARLAEALQKYFTAPIKLHITVGVAEQATPARLKEQALSTQQAMAKESITSDPKVQTLINAFDAKILATKSNDTF
jgi:DNA polymerase-3 subunit gamma/tau